MVAGFREFNRSNIGCSDNATIPYFLEGWSGYDVSLHQAAGYRQDNHFPLLAEEGEVAQKPDDKIGYCVNRVSRVSS